MVVLFPSGAIFVRILPPPAAVWVHGLLQTLALCVLIAAVALGIRLVQDLGNSEINSHFIIGLVVMVCLIIQPIFGFIHHEKFKRLRRRTSASYVHLFNGRIFMTLGIVNGALGLWLAGASDKLKIAYIAAAATMWTLWLLTGIWAEWRIWKMTPRPWQRKKQESPLSWAHELGETSF
ncbi:hypothetical protein C7999DRAFT_40703 [Corynascus novoguineensis]|uniref:Cytochrome b561 domain-containing protein n=1 Tax=Corynascus novoguineensis TaxID=1126955 RepID=A0AAN7HPQ1_9PEZI|nr:hypothetical protein C7999DRAFT_40703 [Corynascus novoguineensis]